MEENKIQPLASEMDFVFKNTTKKIRRHIYSIFKQNCTVLKFDKFTNNGTKTF